MLKSSSDLVITPGEPAGIGPDIVIRLAQQTATDDWVVVADADCLQYRAQLLGLPLRLQEYQGPASVTDANTLGAATRPQSSLRIIHRPCANPVQPGQLNPDNASYVINCLDTAIDGCLNGDFAAMVTGPVQKSVINEGGIAFSGHTEYLQQRCQVNQVVMLLASQKMRVALATTHIPLQAVASSITTEGLREVITILMTSLRHQFNIAKPQLIVSGLNPHAGEGGHLGREEIEIIIPALNELRQQGMDIVGPLPADTMFSPANLASASAFLAMFHDQGLPVLKATSFGEAANITLGLPIIRTSVDHGTALDLAGTGQVDIGSLLYAIHSARDLVRAQQNSG